MTGHRVDIISLACLTLLAVIAVCRIGDCAPANSDDKNNNDLKKLLGQLLVKLKDEADNGKDGDKNGAEIVENLAKIAEKDETSSCGIPAIQPDVSGARIVGGSEARANSWPWQCRMKADLGGGWISLCGASVINSQYLATAAHCMFDSDDNYRRIPDSSYTIYCGDHNRGIRESTEQTSAAELITIHENYNPRGVAYDVAVIKLATRLSLNRYISPICLATTDVPAGTVCYVTGWGQTQNTGSDSVLRQVGLPVVSQSTCRRAYGSLLDSMMCAGYTQGGKDSCQGDSGGPFVCKVHGHWELHGIVSYGKGCAQPGIPGVYSRVTSFRSWITSKAGSVGTGGGGGGGDGGKCPPGYRPCANGQYCFGDSAACDGVNDCGDNSDESNCPVTGGGGGGGKCPPGYQPCDNGQYCFGAHAACDGVNDCGDNSDESDCSMRTTTPTPAASGCVAGQLLCPSGRKCISVSWLCDGDNDCGDNWDERNCPTRNGCPLGYWACANQKYCLPFRALCDRVDQCGDNSDERNCYRSGKTVKLYVNDPV